MLKHILKIIFIGVSFFSLNGQAKRTPDYSPGLPSLGKPYSSSDFNRILGGMMLNATGADVAIFEGDDANPIAGPLDHDAAVARLTRKGVVSTVTINGKQLKKLINLNNKALLSKKFAFFGVDEKARTIRGLSINDREAYKIALSEAALLEGFNIARLGAFNDEYAIRAPFVEAMYGKLDGLFFIAGPKTMTIFDTLESLDDAMKNLRAQTTFAELVDKQLNISSAATLEQYIDFPGGKARPSIAWDISYLDLGFSWNAANKAYAEYVDKDNKGAKLPISRGTVPLHAHVILFSKMNLIFDLPELIVTLGNNTKYMHTNFDAKPERDKTTFNLDFRLPWERSVFKGHDIVFSPTLKNLYETKIAPIPGFSKEDDSKEKAWQKEPRIKRLDTLLGSNIVFNNLGFSCDVGAMMSTDFNRSRIGDALDFGPGFNLDGKWSLFGPVELSTTMLGYYLWPLPQNKADNKIALRYEATLWLRLARFHDFSVSIMSDFLAASLQQTPEKIATSAIFGVTLSYGSRLRLLN